MRSLSAERAFISSRRVRSRYVRTSVEFDDNGERRAAPFLESIAFDGLVLGDQQLAGEPVFSRTRLRNIGDSRMLFARQISIRCARIRKAAICAYGPAEGVIERCGLVDDRRPQMAEYVVRLRVCVNPEWSRRGRGIPTYAALRQLDWDEIIDRIVATGEAFVSARPGARCVACVSRSATGRQAGGRRPGRCA